MSDADIQMTLEPTFVMAPDSAADLVGTIRNILVLGVDDIKELTVEGIKDGFTIHGQYKGASFRWTIHEDGETYLKTWGVQATKTWDFLKKRA